MGLINKLKEKINKIKSKVSKKEFIFIIIFSIMVIFNFFIFNQFDVMFHNQSEFGVNINEVIWLFVWRAIVLNIVLISILTTVCYYSKTKFQYCIAIIFGFTLAGYAQVLFLNKEHLMTVRGTMREESVIQYIINSTLYLAIILLPLALLILEKKKKKLFTQKLATSVIIIVFGMQMMGLVTIAAEAPEPAKNNELYYFSIDEQLKLSKNENIIVFILDRFDTIIADSIFKNHPETKEQFSGFTYYQNNVSAYPGTFPSVASMLTNKSFDKNTHRQIEYLKNAWNEEVLFNSLHENNYKVNGLLDTLATIYDFSALEGKFDNIKKMNLKDRKVREHDFFTAMLSFAQVRQSPDLMKDVFVNRRYYDIANYCIDVRNTPDYFPRTITASADIKFYNSLITTGLSADEEQNVFSFVHLQASHGQYQYNENLEYVKFKKKTDLEKAIAQTRGTFKILDKYFSLMKELEIYDNSTIILLGDHGIWDNTSEITKAVTTSLLIKEKNHEKSALKFDETSQLSNNNLHASLLQLIGASNKKGTNKSYSDIINNNNGIQTRYFYYVRWTNLNSCVYLSTWEIIGDARDIKNWRKMSENELN